MYGIDVHDVLDTRSWRWLTCRILGLLETECRLNSHFTPPEQPSKARRR